MSLTPEFSVLSALAAAPLRNSMTIGPYPSCLELPSRERAPRRQRNSHDENSAQTDATYVPRGLPNPRCLLLLLLESSVGYIIGVWSMSARFKTARACLVNFCTKYNIRTGGARSSTSLFTVNVFSFFSNFMDLFITVLFHGEESARMKN